MSRIDVDVWRIGVDLSRIASTCHESWLTCRESGATCRESRRRTAKCRRPTLDKGRRLTIHADAPRIVAALRRMVRSPRRIALTPREPRGRVVNRDCPVAKGTRPAAICRDRVREEATQGGAGVTRRDPRICTDNASDVAHMLRTRDESGCCQPGGCAGVLEVQIKGATVRMFELDHLVVRNEW